MVQMETKMIGNKIAEARKKHNFSQAQLAEKLFLSAQAVGKWERGESMPGILTLNKLADLLNIQKKNKTRLLLVVKKCHRIILCFKKGGTDS